jgi:glycosyltransferase involved in cell wall biosynthesis
MRTIVTIFAGRKNNLALLNKYLDKALAQSLIQEVHYWNYAREKDDELYIKEHSILRRTSSLVNAEYTEIFPEVDNNSFEISVIASNDVHIKLQKGDIFYEIVLGGWKNTYSVIRRTEGLYDPEVVAFLAKDKILHDAKRTFFTIRIQNGQICVFRKNKLILACDVDAGFTMDHIYMKTGYACSADVWYTSTKNLNYFFFDTGSKQTWAEYYQYYTRDEYKEDVILKCDDDIVFCDLSKLAEYVKFIRTTQNTLVFANIINNGVSAYYQQSKYELIPRALDVYEYPENGFCGTLWSSGQKAERLHNYFLKNYELFLNKDYQKEEIPIVTRFSINFFGIKGSDWFKIRDAGNGDDEYNLTEGFLRNGILTNCLYSPFYVSHLSFGRQNAEFESRDLYISRYDTLFRRLYANFENTVPMKIEGEECEEEFPYIKLKKQKWKTFHPQDYLPRLTPCEKPQIVFIESYTDQSSPWNGRMIREKSGVSGTITACVFLAELLSATGKYDVTFLSRGIVDEVYRGVKYTNYYKIHEFVCDFVFITHNMQDLEMLYDKLKYEEAKPKIISVIRHKLKNISYLEFVKDHQMSVIYTSMSVKENCERINCPSTKYPYTIIPNCIDIYELCEPPREKERAFVFFTELERGFDLAREVIVNFPEFKLYCNTYVNQERLKLVSGDQLIKLDDFTSPKNRIYEILAKSKYFIYPLVNLENNAVHCSSFGYPILEALLHGVVVIAPRMKLYEELYGDAIYYVDAEGDVNPDVFKYWNQYEDDLGRPMIGKYIEAICELESNYFLYNSYVDRGLALKRKFSKETIGERVLSLII